MTTLDIILSSLFLLALLPVAIFYGEVIAGCFPWRRRPSLPAAVSRPRVAVLIPAHNEAAGLASTLRAVQSQLQAGDTLLVVADHCSDTTASIARELGATVVERHDSPQRGKGYALAAGIAHLRAAPPDVVVFIDADCTPGNALVTQLAHEAARLGVPTQALNLCVPPAGSGPRHALAGLAFRFKNLIRLQGLTRLGGACHLTGTGMALPWSLVEQVAWATGNVVEDMQLGIDFTLAGFVPRFLPTAEVRSELPTSEAGLWQQRRRWEHGFLATSLSQTPRLLVRAVRHGSWPAFLLGLDLLVPPLALLAALLVALGLLALLLLVTGVAWMPCLIVATAWVAAGLALALGWSVHGRSVAPWRTLLAMPSYVLAKLPLYAQFLHRRETQWIRAERTESRA